MAYLLIFLLKATQIFSVKICELDTVLTGAVNILTTKQSFEQLGPVLFFTITVLDKRGICANNVLISLRKCVYSKKHLMEALLMGT